MKKGDKIRFNGYQGPGTYNYYNTTVGKLYEIEIVDIYPSGVKAYIYRGDNGKQYIWRAYRKNLKNDFTLVQAERTATSAERGPNTLQEGDKLNDIEWAQEMYQQIQQMEGEHA